MGITGNDGGFGDVIAEEHLILVFLQRQQMNRFIGAIAQGDCLKLGFAGVTGMGEAHQRLHNPADTVSLAEDLFGGFQHFGGVGGVVFQILCEAGDAGDGVADFMGDSRCQSPYRREAF